MAFRGRGYEYAIDLPGLGRLTGVFARHRASRGDEVGLRLDPEGCHLFAADAATPADAAAPVALCRSSRLCRWRLAPVAGAAGASGSGQVLGEALEHLLGAALAQAGCVGAVEAVEEGALLGPGQVVPVPSAVAANSMVATETEMRTSSAYIS